MDALRDRCPICGYQFEGVKEINVCPRHFGKEEFKPEELIGEHDDYAWCL